jgi:hypothetical protein
VPDWLAQRLDVVRVVGNLAVHMDGRLEDFLILALDDTDGAALLEDLLETVNDLVDERITKVRRSNELFNKIPEDIRKDLGRPASETEGSGQ